MTEAGAGVCGPVLQFPGLEKVRAPFLRDSIVSLVFCDTVGSTVSSTLKDLLSEG